MVFDAENFLKNASNKTGVYQMLDNQNKVIYVGKAKNLKSRLSSYFRSTVGGKTALLVSRIADIILTITATEAEAFLLENTLIKQHHPKYNILLRDDKSYPYLLLAGDPRFPSLKSYRGIKRSGNEYFGPYVNSHAMHDALQLIQKLFKIRPCSETFFKNRSRPCLQYQIKRCKAPCVGLVSEVEYQCDVTNAKLFLEGKSQQVLDNLAEQMDEASKKLNYEQAASYRDLISNIRQVQQRQYVINKTGDVDAIAVAFDGVQACVAKLILRDGQLLGSKWFFPKIQTDATSAEIISAFVAQHYLGSEDLPKEIILQQAIDETDILMGLLTEQAKRSITISQPKRGNKQQWLKLAMTNAEQGLVSRNAELANQQQQLEQLQQLLNLDAPITRLECFDISHTQGTATVASCVVFGLEGSIKSDYRRFNISDITPGDDYAAMQQALKRRYSRLQEEHAKLPDVLIIDGGKGQINIASEVLRDLQIESILILGIAKGTSRKPGLETLILADAHQVVNAENYPAALIMLQHIRDEAHRFAITGHRGRRAKSMQHSSLETIEGVGPAKRRELLRRFGGMQQLKKALPEELAKTPGINQKLAQRIYDALHSN